MASDPTSICPSETGCVGSLDKRIGVGGDCGNVNSGRFEVRKKSFKVLVTPVASNRGIAISRNNISQAIVGFRSRRTGAKLERHISSWSGFIVRIPKLEAQSCGDCFGDDILGWRGGGSICYRRIGAVATGIRKSDAGNDGGELDATVFGGAARSIGGCAVGIDVVDDIGRQTFGVVKGIAIGLIG